MKTVITVKNQTIFDIATQHYGDVSLFDKILELNPRLENDYSAFQLKNITIDFAIFDLSLPLKEGSSVIIDTRLINRAVVRELSGIEVIGFDNKDIELIHDVK